MVSISVHRGGTVTLSNRHRTLSTLQVANLRVDLSGGNITGGACSEDQYFGAPLTSAPTSAAAGFPTALVGGSAGTGHICPNSGSPAGLPADTLAQTDETSGGETVTEVADVADTFPLAGETLYGTFTAPADATDGSSPIALTIAKGGVPVFSTSNVDTPDGVTVSGLKPGKYTATWVVTDANGDTRSVTTRFIEHAPTGRAGTARTAGSARTSRPEAQGQLQAPQSPQDQVHGHVPEEPQEARHRAARRLARRQGRGARSCQHEPRPGDAHHA
jgi:hypothetical protein